MKIGVLALQGGFAEHRRALSRLNTASIEIRSRDDFTKDLDGLILPGGESTVMGRLLRETGLDGLLRDAIGQGLPVFGTCAGLILLARSIEGSSSAWLNALDITVRRNAFGKQLGSFHHTEHFADLGPIPMTFIRAPIILKTGVAVEPLARVNGDLVAARTGSILVTAFHPELTQDLTVHRYFLDMVTASPGTDPIPRPGHCGLMI